MTDTPARPLRIVVHPDDNVAIIVNEGGLRAGTVFEDGLRLVEDIPEAHKVALTDLPRGSRVLRYGVPIGTTNADVPRGAWVHEGLLELPPAPQLHDVPFGGAILTKQDPLTGFTFEGFRNEDGTVGTRNILGISTTVQCVAATVDFAVKRIKAELLPKYPNVDDVIGITHIYGCGVAINAPDAQIPIRTLRNLSLNPNLGGAPMVVSLGCEKLQPALMLPASTLPILQSSPYVVRLQDEEHTSFSEMVAAIMDLAEKRLIELNKRQRVTCPASDLNVGMQCGGSDAFSGVTANPAVGFATDLLVRAGATVMFSEVTEVRDGIHLLTARAADEETARSLVREMQWYDDYLQKGGVDRSANPSPGNKKGGLNNIVEKAMGSIAKSGIGAIHGVSGHGERVTKKGLIFAATPASDFVCGTLQLAAGMNMHVFTTGRGTPYGLAMAPVIKVTSRTSLAKRWSDLIDINAGTIATGDQTIEQVGWEIFHMILAVASGRHQTCADRWGLHNEFALFNPAPIT
ncbi:galactarate dehydratase [Terriglobus roseus DSM 18391]|uniref:Galactarate dehydratase n=1 Tax=Terriglobus roseus (strain DSM 18391 / NRRL B-41598 / KBS 63) TaxID=926566 RepID=I3ZMF0_TERRK|nr:galactarate dehydratase [Terriglobus roseus]AFL90418.1 galactarate dehydratase [Terriglobus roseus DSM 18391]